MNNKKTYLNNLRVQNFRNFSELDLSFSPGLNLFIGHNGQGKTNALEAIALSCSLRPMQALHNLDLIKTGLDQAQVLANFSGDNPHEININILERGKRAQLNHKPVKNSSQLYDLSPIVSFIPSELGILSSASLRRRALDQASCGLFPEHALNLKNYEKILLHRNRLLKSWPLDLSQVKIFTTMLIQQGAQVMHTRLQALVELMPYFSEQLSQILGRSCQSGLLYRHHHQDLDSHPPLALKLADLSARLNELSQTYQTAETHRKVTLFGPHLDDLIFILDNLNAQTCASRGQTRALILSFKLAQILAINNMRNHSPIIILDDIVSELDKHKKANLINLISQLNTQAFFSATNIGLFDIKNTRVFKTNQGLIRSLNIFS